MGVVLGVGAVLGVAVILLRDPPDMREGEALTAGLGLLVLVLVAAGVMDSVSMLFRTTILQAATPDSLRGRLQGIFIVVVAGGPRLGDAVMGAGGQWLGPGFAALVGAVICFLLVLLLMRMFPEFMRYDARDPQP